MVTFTQSDVLAHQARLKAIREAKTASKASDHHITAPLLEKRAINDPGAFQRHSEKKLQEQIMAWLRLHGVRAIVHSRTDRPTTQQKGVADILYVVYSVPVAMEVKVGNNQCTPEQVGWLEAARLDGWTVGVVRSLDQAIALHELSLKGKQ